MGDRRIRRGIVAAILAFAVYGIAVGAELLIIGVVHPSEQELTWVSDALLAVAFGFVTYLQLNLKATRTVLTTLERERLVWETELSLAAEIQRGLLPPSSGQCCGLSWAARLKQAHKVGGDLYDFVQLDSTRVLFILGDISGKGIPAALLQSSAHTLLRMLIYSQTEPGSILEVLSRSLHQEHKGAMFMTCILGWVDIAKGTLSYVNAGHPTGLVFGAAGSRYLGSTGKPVGILPNLSYPTQTISLNAGDIVLLVSDGIAEQAGNGDLAWIRLATSVLKVGGPGLDPDDICNRLFLTLTQISHRRPFEDWEDDQTAVALRYES
ncbi:MAG: PP2C family protein-serine/threonine phosphatase [Acidobacteriota bacterium]